MSSFLSDVFWLPFQFRAEVQREIGMCLWRVELAEKWLGSAPFLTGKLSLWNNPSWGLSEKREPFWIFRKCYCHSSQRNISEFKFEEHGCSLCDTLEAQTGDGAGARVQEENQLQTNVSHDLSSRMSRLQGPTPPTGALLHPCCWKTGPYTSSELPTCSLKIFTFCSNPPKTPLWIL